MNKCFNVNCNQCDDTLVCWFVSSSSSSIGVANIVDGFYLQTFDGCRSTIYVDGVPSSSFLETNHYFTGSTSLNSTTNDGTYGGYEIGEECDICNSGSRNVSISNAHVVEYGIKPLENGKHTIISESMAYLSNLVRVYIPSNVSSIKKRGFSSCGNLSDVTIGEGTTSIGSEAFQSCTKLKYIDWGCCGKNLTLGANAFNSCGFENLDISDCITSAGYSCFGNNINLRSVTIGRGLKMLSDSVFTDCQSLASVTFRETSKVASIGDNAFNNCYNLSSITIPNSVKSIGDNAFHNCYDLSSITIPNSVTSIARRTFHNCVSLTSVTIPNSVKSIGDDAFASCNSLTSITIPNSVTSIGDNAFNNCTSLTSVTIPNSVTSIAIGTFHNCLGLTIVTIPNSVKSIGDNAFGYCTSLSSINIPNSVKSIGDNVFNNCYNLSSITIPNSVTSIGDNAFNNCTSLTSVKVLSSTPPNLGTSVFPSSVKIYVPSYSVETYKAATNWSDYADNIYPI